MASAKERSVSFEGAEERAGFTMVPNNRLTSRSVSLQARMTYVMLRYYAWQDEECWPGQERLAELLGVSERSLRGYISELVGVGWVRVERRGLGMTNRYVVTSLDRQPASGSDRQPASGLDRQPASGPIEEEDSVEEDSVGSVRSEEARQVFAYWCEKLDHPRAKFDSVRRRKIVARLADGFTVDELKLAIDGCSRSDFHMGDNQDRKKYDDIGLICRDAAHVERFMEQAATSGGEFDWAKLGM